MFLSGCPLSAWLLCALFTPHVIIWCAALDSVEVEPSPHFGSSASWPQVGRQADKTTEKQQQPVAHDRMDQGCTTKLEKGAWPESSGEAEPLLETASIVQATSRWTASPVDTPAPRGMRGQSCTRPAGNLTSPSLRFLLAAKMLTCKARASAAPSRPGRCYFAPHRFLAHPWQDCAQEDGQSSQS
ncbi:uncharacterized protein TRIREDRAFT_108418 [Trichoderma reesei QM6a]|uniref:Predicted protein n=2 Tax=Hypocrea jecorina TaxID=51453 RepID=G0RM70_HYPJQ|nr:uncharacterized protein TRIREDRAFT_108418 [Trichoderma reesei QM6a]EGR47610.1 predicted protein [Trichoderma reesei QM6a]ETS01298.1 hypothetical protein M419DRAFT_81627 [Trichoderma reesei RUT C-30]